MSRAGESHGEAQKQFAYLEPAALQELKDLRFAARRIVEGTFAGRHRSALRGSSVEFADYREYTPGDDLRRLDWKVYMRLRRPYVRTFDEETNLSCLLIMDTSASMNFGGTGIEGTDKTSCLSPQFPRGKSLTKLDYARYLAAGLAYLIVNNRDQAGLALIGNKLDGWCEPRSTTVHLNEMLSMLEKATIAPGTRLAAGLETLFSMCRRRGLLVLISDFLDDDIDALFEVLRLFRHRRFEVILFHLVHPEELVLPPGRSYRFFDPEGSGEAEVDPQDVEQQYIRGFELHRQRVRNMALGAGCEYELIDTRTPYPDAIRSYLRARQAVSG